MIDEEWVNFNITNTLPPIIQDEDYSGSLFSVDEINGFYVDTPVTIEDSGWDCLGKRACELDDDSTFCVTFEPLMDAGRIYLNIEFTVFGFLVLWHNFLVNSILFSREWGHPILIYITPHVAWILHLAAVVCWSVISKVKFERGDCENVDVEPDERLDICIKSGPIIIIVQLILMVVFAIYFTFIYYNRKQKSTSIASEDLQLQYLHTRPETEPPSQLKDGIEECLSISPILVVNDIDAAIKLYT